MICNLSSLPVTVLLFAVGVAQLALSAESVPAADAAASTDPVGLFDAMERGDAEVDFIARNDRQARLLITNNTNQPLNVRLPEAFAGVHALAQFGGGGLGGGRGGGGRAGGGTFGGGGAQAVGGGMGGGGMMGGGGGMMGGGGGMFSIPPEQTAKINLAVVCLDHGLKNPSSSMPYKIVPTEEYLDRPAMIELLKAFGRGELNHRAVQAATWHLNNDLTWNELAAKRQGTRRSLNRPPYFSPQELQAAVAYATEAQRLAYENRELYERPEVAEETRELDSESRSTTDVGVEPEVPVDGHEDE